MAYKILGKDLKEGYYYTMIGSKDIFVFIGSGFKNLADGNLTISKHKYHKFRPYFLQTGDKINIDFGGSLEGDETFLEVEHIEFNLMLEKYKVVYCFLDNTLKLVRGSWTLSRFGINKIKIL